jgi:hypothetical protein
MAILAAAAAAQPSDPLIQQVGPATAELRAICQADQAGRDHWEKLTAAQRQALFAADKVRRARVKQLLDENLVTTGEDYGNAALIFQHGHSLDDFLTAHELGFLASVHGSMSSMLAISEDRWLTTLKRRQRFGSQFDLKLAMDPVEDSGPAAVTDQLRSDFMEASLAHAKKYKVGALSKDFPSILARLQNRLGRKFLAAKADSPESRRLLTLSDALPRQSASARRSVLKLYARDAIWGATDYYHAAQILVTSRRPSELLLAHEFAAVAAFRHQAKACRLFAETLDRYMMVTRLRTRYGTGHGPVSDSVSRAVRIALGLRAGVIR